MYNLQDHTIEPNNKRRQVKEDGTPSSTHLIKERDNYNENRY